MVDLESLVDRVNQGVSIISNTIAHSLGFGKGGTDIFHLRACIDTGTSLRPILAPFDRPSPMPFVIRRARTPRCWPRLNDLQKSESIRSIRHEAM